MAEGPPAPFGSMKLNAVRLGRHHLCHLALTVPEDISAGTGFGQDNCSSSLPCCTKTLCLAGAGWKRPAARQGAACEPAALPTKGPGLSPSGAHLHHTGPSRARLLPKAQTAGDLKAEQESLHDAGTISQLQLGCGVGGPPLGWWVGDYTPAVWQHVWGPWSRGSW